MNILLMTGSPRPGGNSDLMADAFIRGAERKGHKVIKYRTALKKIAPCKVCNCCGVHGAFCTIEDDFNQLAGLIESSEGIVLASPLYWYSFSAQLKLAIDRIYAMMHSGKAPRGKLSALLACCEDDAHDAFDGMKSSYELICRYLEWNIRGMVLIGGLRNIGDINRTAGIAKAEELGENFAEKI